MNTPSSLKKDGKKKSPFSYIISAIGTKGKMSFSKKCCGLLIISFTIPVCYNRTVTIGLFRKFPEVHKISKNLKRFDSAHGNHQYIRGGK